MYYGFTESESFNDPTILNTYHLHKAVIEKRPGGKGFWHIFILSIADNLIEKTVKDISSQLKSDWNAVFFNETTVYCVFQNKVFTLQRKQSWELSDYLEIKEYAKAADVGDLDMNEVFRHYESLLSTS